MNVEQVRGFVLTYLDAYQCDIMEKAPTHVTVKLSVEADKELTNRAYYWGFVERTGAPAQTMTMTFVFDPAAYHAAKSAKPFAAGGAGTARAAGPPPPGTGAAVSAATAAAVPRGGAAGSALGASGPTGAAGVRGAATEAGGSAAAAGDRAAGASASGAAGAAGAAGAGSSAAAGGAAAAGGGMGTSDSILGRYFGFVPTTVTARVPTDDVTFGSRRLLQLFGSAKAHGRFVRLFEEPHDNGGASGGRDPAGAAGRSSGGFDAAATGLQTGYGGKGDSVGARLGHGGGLTATAATAATAAGVAPPAAYETWLLVNYKVEFICDMKRSEIHSLAISLATGQIRERFYEDMLSRRLTPRLPGNIRLLPDTLPLEEAVARLEAIVEHKVRSCEHSWADRANEQLQAELDRMDGYYGSLLQSVEPDKRAEVEAQHDNRRREIDWQYRPRIVASAVNCGFFHLQAETRR
jgi:hypothetical protein